MQMHKAVRLIIFCFRQLNLLLRTIVVLLIAISIGLVVFPDIMAYRRPVSAAPSKPTAVATLYPVVIPSPAAPTNLAHSYDGTIYNIPMHRSTTMFLTDLQSSQESIRGYFIGLNINGSVQGSINASKEVRFTVTEKTGQVSLAFDGWVQSSGDISGSYCSMNRKGQCAGQYGIWSVAPTS